MLVIVAAYARIELRVYFPKGSAPRTLMVQSHYVDGLAVLALLLPQILSRLRTSVPLIVPAPGKLVAFAARALHFSLYAFCGREESVYGGTDHLLSARGGGRHAGEGAVPQAWLQRGLVLPVAQPKFGGVSLPDAKCLKELETENGRLKKLLTEQVLEGEVIKDAP